MTRRPNVGHSYNRTVNLAIQSCSAPCPDIWALVYAAKNMKMKKCTSVLSSIWLKTEQEYLRVAFMVGIIMGWALMVGTIMRGTQIPEN